MSYGTILLPRAQKEVEDAWEWYEDKVPGLGDRFKYELYKRIEEIEEHPERYLQRMAPYRETRIKIFPYLVIYFIDEERNLIMVTSVFHTSRNPKKKYKK